MLDEVSQAVLAREEVVKYLREASGREKVHSYLEELRTTQRYHMYRALQHPLYPILRKIEKIPEQTHNALNATRDHRVVYTSPIFVRIILVSASTSPFDSGSTPDTEIGAPNVTKTRDR